MKRRGYRWRAVTLGALLVGLAAVRPAGVHAATDTVSTCDESTLRSVISGAAAGDTVNFGCSGTITLTDGGGNRITLSKNLTIDGSGQAVTISGGRSVGVFLVNTGVAVTVNDLTIANGDADTERNGSTNDGGGILNDGGTLSVTNSTFSGNDAHGTGGGIANVAGTLSVTNSTFSGNHSGGISNFSGATLTITNSTFSDNSNFAGVGGGILNDGTLTITNSTFSGNSSNILFANGGGGIANNGTLTITNSTFSGNSGGGSDGGGGILNNGGTLTITNSTFSGNVATTAERGGGGGIDNEGGTLSVTNSTFSGNGANNGGGFGGTGGAIYNNGGSVSLTTSTFSANNAGDNTGGAIASAGGTLTISGSTFSDNFASFGGAINLQTGAATGGTLTISNSTFSGNNVGHPEGCMCGGSGGAILNDGLLSVSNSTFSDNSAPGGSGGGVVNGGTASVVNSTFSGNSATSFGGGLDGGGSGGGILNYGGGTLNVTNGTFSGNSAPIGAGIDNQGTVNLANTILASSTVGNCGGPITDRGGNLADDGTCGATVKQVTTAALNLDPMGLQDNGGPTQTIALLPGSVAIDFTSCPQQTSDQRGFPRPDASEATCDSGAFEFQDPVDTDLGLTNLPANIITEATSPAGAVVSYPAPTAVDETGDSTAATVGCSQPSGSTFPIGITTVTCTATDSDDTNSPVSASFTVTVKGAAAQIDDLISLVDSFNLTHGPRTSLEVKPRHALTAVQAGATTTVCGDLTAFGNEARAQSGKQLTTAQANQLLAAARNIMNVLGC